MSKPATSLVITRQAIVDTKGVPSRDMIKWFQEIDRKTNASLTLLGIDPTAIVGNRNGTIGTTLQNITGNGMVTAPGVGFTLGDVPGSISGGQVGFTLDAVTDGTVRFAVAQVDGAKLAIINFADAAHQNKTLDNVNDGTIYQRFTRVASGQLALPTSLIAVGTSTTASVSVSKVLTTDAVEWAFAGTPAAAYSSLVVSAYVTLGTINFQVANPSVALGVTPGAQTVNYVVIR